MLPGGGCVHSCVQMQGGVSAGGMSGESPARPWEPLRDVKSPGLRLFLKGRNGVCLAHSALCLSQSTITGCASPRQDA